MLIPGADEEQRGHVKDDLALYLMSSLGDKRMIYMLISGCCTQYPV
jgi:hypothetical protein